MILELGVEYNRIVTGPIRDLDYAGEGFEALKKRLHMELEPYLGHCIYYDRDVSCCLEFRPRTDSQALLHHDLKYILHNRQPGSHKRFPAISRGIKLLDMLSIAAPAQGTLKRISLIASQYIWKTLVGFEIVILELGKVYNQLICTNNLMSCDERHSLHSQTDLRSISARGMWGVGQVEVERVLATHRSIAACLRYSGDPIRETGAHFED